MEENVLSIIKKYIFILTLVFYLMGYTGGVFITMDSKTRIKHYIKCVRPMPLDRTDQSKIFEQE